MRNFFRAAALCVLAFAPGSAPAETGAYDRAELIKRIRTELMRPVGSGSVFEERQPGSIEQRGEPRGNYGAIWGGFHFHKGVEYGFAYIESRNLLLIGLPQGGGCREERTIALDYPSGEALGVRCQGLFGLLSTSGTAHFWRTTTMRKDLDDHLALIAPWFGISPTALRRPTADVSR